MKTILRNSILALAVLLVSTAASRAQTAYAIANNGNSLIKFDLATPGITTLAGNFSGAATNLDGIDFRPADGLLYGYGINPAINETAYTNSDTNPLTGTSLFYLDYGRDILVRTLDPNAAPCKPSVRWASMPPHSPASTSSLPGAHKSNGAAGRRQ